MAAKPELKKERQEWAREQLRDLVKPGDRVKTSLKHGPNSNGDKRSIAPVIGAENETYLVSLAIGQPVDGKHGGVKMVGGGMDMGFELVYRLSLAIYPTYNCIGDGERRCGSPEHVNRPNQGEPDTRRDYSSERTHKDGYALSFGGWL